MKDGDIGIKTREGHLLWGGIGNIEVNLAVLCYTPARIRALPENK